MTRRHAQWLVTADLDADDLSETYGRCSKADIRDIQCPVRAEAHAARHTENASRTRGRSSIGASSASTSRYLRAGELRRS